MTPHAEAFVAALKAVCVAHQLDLDINAFAPASFLIFPLFPGAVPLRYAAWEEETDGEPEGNPGATQQ